MSPFTEKRFLPVRDADEDEKKRLLKLIKEELSGEKQIVFVYVHGSFISSGPFRDVDVAVFVINGAESGFESELSYRLSSQAGYEMEVHVINDAPVAFQMSVLRDGRLLFSKDEVLRTDFIEDVSRRYREYAHFRNVFMEAVSGTQRQNCKKHC